MPQFDSPQVTTGDNGPRDKSLAQQMHAEVSEAAERVTFHRGELERWNRVGRAAGAAVLALENSEPIGQTTPDDFLGKGVPQPAQGQSW